MADERDRPARRQTARKEEHPDVPTGAADVGASAGAELAGTARETMEQVREMARDAAVPVSRDVGQPAAESDITNELGGGGVAFGEFVKSVGLAVAAAQAELDATLVKTAEKLSNTQIDTVAVFEQQIKDDTGAMDEGRVHIQKLPLTNYIMPTAYNWSRVYLEADMNVQEFNSRSGFNIQQKHFSADTRITGNAGMLGWGVSGTAGVSYGQSSTGVDSSYGQDVAAGKLHMEATLEPRHDIELPRPFILQKGPRLTLRVTGREPIMEGDGADKKQVGQRVKVIATLLKTDNSPNGGKQLTINLSDPSLNYTTSNGGATDATKGEVEYEIERRASAEDLAKPLPAMVRVSFGLVTSSTGVSL
jgi:hypothetical protein